MSDKPSYELTKKYPLGSRVILEFARENGTVIGHGPYYNSEDYYLRVELDDGVECCTSPRYVKKEEK